MSPPTNQHPAFYKMDASTTVYQHTACHWFLVRNHLLQHTLGLSSITLLTHHTAYRKVYVHNYGIVQQETWITDLIRQWPCTHDIHATVVMRWHAAYQVAKQRGISYVAAVLVVAGNCLQQCNPLLLLCKAHRHQIETSAYHTPSNTCKVYVTDLFKIFPLAYLFISTNDSSVAYSK